MPLGIHVPIDSPLPSLKAAGVGDAPTSIGQGESPHYAALARAIDQFHADLLPPLAAFRARVFTAIGMDAGSERGRGFTTHLRHTSSGAPALGRSPLSLKDSISRTGRKAGKEQEEGPFETSFSMLDEVRKAAEALFTQLAGPDRSRYGFVHRDPEDDTPDGVIQQHEWQAFAVGVQRAGRLMQAATDVPVSRQSPAVEAMLSGAFDRLSQNGHLRLEGILDDVHGIMLSGAANGLSPLAVARQLGTQFDAYQGWEFKRLARTEAAFAAERGTRDQLKGFGVEQVEILVSADACPICQEYEGTVQGIDDESNLPPFHPACACSVAPVASEEGGEAGPE